MIDPTLLKAFWHRTRKQPVPWTAQEIAGRLGVDLDDALSALNSQAHIGLARAERKNRKGGSAIWQLTKLGEKTLAHMIKAEELIKK